MNEIWYLHLNPFFWQGVVFSLFGFLSALAVNSLFGFPKRLLEAF